MPCCILLKRERNTGSRQVFKVIFLCMRMKNKSKNNHSRPIEGIKDLSLQVTPNISTSSSSENVFNEVESGVEEDSDDAAFVFLDDD